MLVGNRRFSLECGHKPCATVGEWEVGMTIAVLLIALLTLFVLGVLVSWGLGGCMHRYVEAESASYGEHRFVVYLCEKCGAQLDGTT